MEPLGVSFLLLLSYLLPLFAVIAVMSWISSIAASLQRIAAALEKKGQ
ncbi:hypothetical protein NKI63_12725 [Mesorhizobium sp. M0410]